MKHNNSTRQVSMRMFLVLIVMVMSSAFVMAQDNYGFKVGGVDVTSDNYLDLTEINGVSGKVYFDPIQKPSLSTMPPSKETLPTERAL
ncbi:MAG: hypothetical protein MR989_03465 [Prevotella sp.]|nr:hypothetical protein [Prevotella sp.]